MLITGFPAGPWATNCYVLAPAPNSECIIIDPGFESLDQIKDVVMANHLKPVAALLTHGHIDHMWSITPLADGYSIPAMIHESDKQLLANPELGVSDAGRDMIVQIGGTFSEPAEVKTFRDDVVISILGYSMNVIHLPGHTPGSVGYLIKEHDTFFSGDVLFQSGIGRTDLPGGNLKDMKSSIQKLFNEVSDETTVLCGHGDSTTIREERRHNPYIQNWIQHG